MARTTVEAQLAKIRKAKEVLEKKEKALLNRNQDKAIAKIVQLATVNGINAVQISKALKVGTADKSKTTRAKRRSANVKVAPKYRNPADMNQTWTGRGRAPLWAAELQKAGKLDSALIKI